MRFYRFLATLPFAAPLAVAVLLLALAGLFLGEALLGPEVFVPVLALVLVGAGLTMLAQRTASTVHDAAAKVLQETQLFGVIGELPWPLLMLEDGLIVYANAAAVRFLHVRDAGELTGRPLPSLVAVADEARVADWLRTATAGRVPSLDVNVRLPDQDAAPTQLLGAWVEYGERRMLEVQLVDRSLEVRAQAETAHLASFPSRNPQPIVEINVEGEVTYSNEAAHRVLPGLEAAGAVHPYFVNLDEWRRRLAAGEAAVSGRCSVDGAIYEQEAILASDGQTIRVYGWDVTHREQARAALRDSEERFNLLFRLSPVGKCVSRLSDGLILEANDSFARLLGYDSTDELVGRTVDEIRMWEDRAMRHRIARLVERVWQVPPRVVTVRTRTGVRRRAIGAAVRITINGETCALGLLLDVEEQERLRAEVRAERDFVRSIIDTAGQGLLICDANYRVQYVNPALLRMTGYSQEEAFQCDPRLLLHPDDQARLFSEEGAEATSHGHLYESQVRRRDGTYLDALVAAVPRVVDGAFAGVTVVVVDVTEQRQATQQMERMRRFYEHILHGLPLDVIVMDPEGRYLFLNEHAVRDPDLREQLVGARDADYAHLRGRDQAMHARRQAWVEEVIRSKQASELEETFEAPEGPRHLLRVARPVLDATGEVAYVVGYSLDLTTRKRYESELVRARDEAEELSALKSTFIANMSHEVRTPLTAVIGFAEVLQDEIDEPQLRELAALIHQSGVRLLETLNSVLDLARMQAGAMPLALHSANLVPLLRTTLDLFRSMAMQKGLALEGVLPGEPVEARVDAPAFNRVMNNLLSNAIKFTEAGTVRVEVGREAGQAVVIVRDTGIGMDAAFLEEAFEEFRQESVGLSRSHPGSGLGLAIVKRLVDLMQGTIAIESEKGQGTTVTLAFPLAETK